MAGSLRGTSKGAVTGDFERTISYEAARDARITFDSKFLELERKGRMAYEVLKRIIMKMPPEKRLAIWNTFADDLPEVLKSVSVEKRREILTSPSQKSPSDSMNQEGMNATRTRICLL